MSTTNDFRIRVTFCHRYLGTASGWDGDLCELMWFYDFEAHPAVALPKGTLYIDWASDKIYVNDSNGVTIIDHPLIGFLNTVTRQP